MTEEQSPADVDAVSDPAPAGAISRLKGMDPARHITIVVLAIVAVLFAWHIAADRATPYSDLGKVDGYIVPVAPQVSGYVTDVPVVLNQAVERGDLLLRINPVPYELAVNSARAQLELSGQQVRAQTEIRAPGHGIVGDLQLAEGHYAVAGQPLATFISGEDVWVRADMRENNLGRIEVGHPAEVTLDVAPGRVFRGHVASVSAGVDTGEGTRGGLPTAESAQGWLQDPQRFPVIIRFDDAEARGFLRTGGRASVLVFTGSNPRYLAAASRDRITRDRRSRIPRRIGSRRPPASPSPTWSGGTCSRIRFCRTSSGLPSRRTGT